MAIPKDFSFVEAAAIPEVFMTAYQALVYLSQLQASESILVHAGASGVGTAAIQLAKAIGAKIFVTASYSKHDICLQLGATKAIDYKNEDFKKQILDATNNEGVDVIIDFIAAPYFNKNIELLRKDGRLALLALMGGVQVEDFNFNESLNKQITNHRFHTPSKVFGLIKSN